MFIALSQRLVAPTAAESTVAYRDGMPILWHQFAQHVATLAHGFKGRSEIVPQSEDRYYFLLACLAAMQADVPLRLSATPDAAALTDADIAHALTGEHTLPLRPLEASQIALHVETSGSTGAPKRLAKTISMLEQELHTLHTAFGAEMPEGPVLATVPHAHFYGLMFSLLWPLSAGWPIDATRHPYWETLLPRCGPSVTLVTSPAHLKRLAGLTLSPAMAPGRIFSAGAPLSPETAQQAHRSLGCPITEIFGSSETGAIATRVQQTASTPWRALPGVTCRADDTGHLLVEAPYAPAHPFRLDDTIAPTDTGGFHHLGRSDRVRKIEGKRLSLTAVEHALSALPGIEAAAVVALETPRECLGAVVVLGAHGQATLAEQGKAALVQQFRRALQPSLDPLAIPRYWRFTEALPLNALGKASTETLERMLRR